MPRLHVSMCIKQNLGVNICPSLINRQRHVMLWGIALCIAPFLIWNPLPFWVEVKQRGGQREITLLWVSHLHTHLLFAPAQPLFCFCSILLHPIFEVSNHLKANKKGWEGHACPEVEQSHVSFVVIAKLCDLNAGYLKKEHCSSCMTAWTKRYWIM